MKFITLTNEEGKTITVRFRSFRSTDAESVINLVRDEYGEKYHKRKMYDKNYIIHADEEGSLKIFLAELIDGKIIGMIGIQRNLPKDRSCSIVSIITLKEYRKYGMFWHFARYIYSRIRKMQNVSAIYCRMVTYHDMTQKLMERLGLKVCAFVPNLIIADKFQHSYPRDENLKNTLVIMERKIQKSDVGTIYLSNEQVDIANKIYTSLKLKYEINTEEAEMIGESEIEFANDDNQETCTIEIHKSGVDLVTKIKEIHSQFTGKYQTFNIFLNISDPSAIKCYNELKKLGYFFTGFKPICEDNEIMIMHNAGDVKINFDTLKLIDSFVELKNYIKESRNKN